VKRRKNHPPKQAFTLVELSIVLVILGLLVGGVLAGQSLIRAAEIRKVVTQATNYKTAVYAFKEKYMALPGDMTNASSFWGLQSAVVNTCMQVPASGTATCNGDGDGKIDYDNGAGADNPYEGFRAWQHMANAGIIEGTYTGAATNVTLGYLGYQAGVNTPPAPMNGFWAIFYLDASQGFWAEPIMLDKHYIVFSTGTPDNAGWEGRWLNSVISPPDMWSVDVKMDDGKPHRGNVTDIVGDGYTDNCATDKTDPDADYNLALESPACSGMFKIL